MPFDREVSIVAARGRDGAFAAYPLVENHHRDGILRLTLAPAPGRRRRAAGGGRTTRAHGDGRARLRRRARDRAVRAWGSGCSRNEMAPRVHNSGHWTIDGAETSQFENHLRAVAGLPLGSTEPRRA